MATVVSGWQGREKPLQEKIEQFERPFGGPFWWLNQLEEIT
jgi:hypothetical protein